MPDQLVRVGGSGYTAFLFGSRPLVFVDIVSDQAPRPVAAPEVIQPMDKEHPEEIAFALALGAGTVTLTLREEWTRNVWEQIPRFDGGKSVV